MSPDDPLLITTRAIIDRVAGASRAPVDAGPETPLADGFWLDSVELLEVLVACEHEFGIEFDETADLDWSGLETLGALAALIRSRKAAAPQDR